MGGVIQNLLKKAPAVKPALASVEAVMSETPIGKTLFNYFQTKIEPKIAAETMALTKSKNLNIQEAKSLATRVVRDNYRTDDAIAYTLNAARQHVTQTQGPAAAEAHVRRLAHSLDIYLEDAKGQRHSIKAGGNNPNKYIVPPGWKERAGLKGKDLESYYTPTSTFEQKSKKWLGVSLLPRIAIAHLSQSANDLMQNSYSDAVKGLRDFVKDRPSAIREADTAGLFTQEYLHEFHKINTGVMSQMDKIFNKPGFSQLRRQQLALSGQIGKHAALAAAQEIQANSNSKWANATLLKLGLDPRKIAANGFKLTQEEIGTAMYRNADEAFFINRNTRSPYYWHHNPETRILTLYHDYSFNQSKFLKDSFKDAWKNDKPKFFANIATMALVFPMFGEMVKSLSMAATLQNPLKRDHSTDPISVSGVANTFGAKLNRDNSAVWATDEYIDSLMHIGGFAIMYEMLHSARRHHSAAFLGGPYISIAGDAMDTIGYIATSNKKGIDRLKPLIKNVERRIPLFGAAIANQSKEHKVWPYDD